MNYYSLSPRNSHDVAIACAPENTPPYFTLMDEMVNCLKAPFDFTLKKVSFRKNGSIDSSDLSGLKYLWFDLQPNTYAWPLMSQKLRNIIDQFASGEEHCDWIPININSEADDSETYFVLRFKREHDVLDMERSVFH